MRLDPVSDKQGLGLEVQSTAFAQLTRAYVPHPRATDKKKANKTIQTRSPTQTADNQLPVKLSKETGVLHGGVTLPPALAGSGYNLWGEAGGCWLCHSAEGNSRPWLKGLD